MRYIGKEMSRVDGVAKVTGKAKYAAEFQVKNLAYGFIVQGSIAKGRITSIKTEAAARAPGVILVLTHSNSLKPAPQPEGPGGPDKSFRALQSDRIVFNGQPVALVVAETFEQARYGARLVEVAYAEEKPATDTKALADKAEITGTFFGPTMKPRGNPAEALKSAPVKVEAEFSIPIEHHNPMEPHGAIAFWTGDKLTIFDKSQDVYSVRHHLATTFGVPEENVNVLSPFVGGAFGSSLAPNYYPALTAMAAKLVSRPVKCVYTRRQMFTGHGYRPYTLQRIALGAEKNGKLTAIVHEATNNTSTFDDYPDSATLLPRLVYACPNVDSTQKLVRLDLATPCPMRAPGAVSGMFALESAMDELAYALKIDPLELRLINYAEKDPEDGRPFSSKALRECYLAAAEKFGWKARKFEPRSMRDGRLLVGWGMATGVWGAFQMPATVKVRLTADGTAHVVSATSDIGPGTYTVITMIAAEYLGLPIEKVTFELGDSSFPRAPAQGGSWTTASVGSAVYGAAQNIAGKLLELANRGAGSPLKGVAAADVELLDGKLRQKGDASKSVDVAELLRRNGQSEIVETFTSQPSPERQKYSSLAHGAQFVEVKVDPDLGTVRVTRAIEATACGRIINPKASHSQEIGGVVWGIGMALHEETEIDHRYGRIMGASLQHYHVPVNADVHEVETMFVEEEDTIVNPLGVKGMGELGMVGIPAAIANAVFHATGKRIRDLPITPDKLL